MKNALCVDGVCIDLSTVESIVVTDSVDSMKLTNHDTARTVKFLHGFRDDFEYLNYDSHQQAWAIYDWITTYLGAKRINVNPASLVTEQPAPELEKYPESAKQG